ncbi:MAG TPA: cadherin-like domain-containing protein [Pirellulales bacterium]
MIRRRFKGESSDRKRKAAKQLHGYGQRRLTFEPLETRNMLSVTLDPTNLLTSQTWSSPDGKYLYLPLNSTDSDGAATVSYSASSSDPSLSPVILQNGISGSVESLDFNISGTDSNGNAFTGDIVIQLFGSLTPNTVAHIESLVNSNFYNGLDFFRVLDNFIAQTGSSTNNGQGGSSLGAIFDEYTPELTFNSPGLVAMADSGHNTDDSQIFITDTDLGNTYESQGDYAYTIFGQVTSGFGILQDMMGTAVQDNSSGEDSSPKNPITITSATLVKDNVNAVLQLYIPAGYTNTSSITVTATDSDTDSASTVFNVQGATDKVADTPFFTTPFGKSAPFTINSNAPTSPILATPENTAVTFTVPVTDTNAGATLKETLLEYDSSTGVYDEGATDATATYSYSATSGTTGNLTVTITPKAGFSGVANLELQLTDNKANNAGGADLENFALNVTDTPVVKTNEQLVTAVGDTSTITTSLLQFTDPNYGASQLTYTLSTVPSNGTLELNNNALVVGKTFTQADIDSNELAYTSTGAGAASDNFNFAVSNPASVNSAATTFSIDIEATNVPPTLSTNAGLTLNEDTTATITTADLQVTDPPKTSGQLIYTVATLPANGTLSDSGTALAVGSTFTQADIDANKLTYANAGGTTDSFAFTVSDDAGGSISKTTFAITVTPAAPPAPSSVTLDSGSNTGGFTGFNYTSDDTPQIDITATAGDTVTLQMNGKTVATATATSSTSGQYVATLPSDTLAVGVNSITAIVTNGTGSSPASTALSITYAPSYQEVYTVPGVPGTAETLNLSWISRSAAYNDEIGVYTVTSMTGTANGVAPGATGYAQAAVGFSSSQVIFVSGDVGGESDTIQVTAGQMLAFYMIQNDTSSDFLTNNSTDSLSAGPVAFFTITAANPDGVQHVQVIANPTTGQVQLNWEDMTGGGDSDFNDVVMTIVLAGGPTGATGALQLAGGGSGNTDSVGATLDGGTSLSSAPGDIGFYYVTDAAGDIGSTAPGSAGYAAAALASGNYQVLFADGQATGASASLTAPAGKLLAFYSLSSGTTSQFVSANPTNSSSGGPVAFFSFNSANPDSTDHLRFTSPEGVATSPSQLELHIMDQLFGNDNDYDSLALNLNIGS